MKETTFIENKKEKWKRFEKLNKSNYQDPEELSNLFVEITEDLSYAKTNYPKRTVRVYLNYLAQNVFTNFYKKSKNETNKFWSFWSYGLPLEMYRSRKESLVAWLIFFLTAFIGFIATIDNPDFARVILGDVYIEVTLDNIAKGEPVSIYDQQGEGLMATHIVFNNIIVTFIAFILGLIATIGTLAMLTFFGLMVGTFMTFLYTQDVALSSISTILLHGTLEISAVVIGAAAGIVLGKGLLFPGTYSRGQSLQIAGKRGVKIMIGLIPVFIVAGVIEGFVTRHDEMALGSKLFIILTSLSFVVFYFIVFPWLKFRNNKEALLQQTPVYRSIKKVELYKIKKSHQIFTETFSLARENFKNYSKAIFLIIIPISLIYLGFHLFYESHLYGFVRSAYTYNDIEIHSRFHEQYWYSIMGRFFGTGAHFSILKFVATSLLITLNLSAVLHTFINLRNTKKPFFKSYFSFTIKNSWKILLMLIPYLSFFYFGNGIVRFVGTLATPLFFFGLVNTVKHNGFKPKLNLAFKNFGSNLGIFIIFFAMTTIAMFVVHNPLTFVGSTTILFAKIEEFFIWNLSPFIENELAISAGVKIAFYIFFLHLMIPLFTQAFMLQSYSIEEKEEAIGLRDRLKKFGTTNKIFESNE